jgi:hypothetical protein
MAHDTKLNLSQRLLKVMEAVKYVKKDVTVPGSGRGVARDAVVAEIRDILLNNGIIVHTSQVGLGRYLETTRKSGSGTPMCSYAGFYQTTFTNVDDFKEQMIVGHEAQGDDFGDKAPGKAATYAEKLNLIKGLLLETGLNDEGRNSGDGDGKEGGEDGQQDGTPTSIKPPKGKAAPKETKADTTPASAGLLTMLKAQAEAKGVLTKVKAGLDKKGLTFENLTAAQAKGILTKIKAEPEPDDEE